MFHFSAFPRAHSFSDPVMDCDFHFRPFLAFFFLSGLIFGSVIGLFSDSPQELLFSSGLISTDISSVSFFQALWHASRFLLAAFFLASGISGLVLLPLLFVFRGFTFACCVSSLLLPSSIRSILISFLSLGIPMLLELPALMIAEMDGFEFSRCLLSSQRFTTGFSAPLLRRAFFSILVCLADAVYICFFLPRLLALLS